MTEHAEGQELSPPIRRRSSTFDHKDPALVNRPEPVAAAPWLRRCRRAVVCLFHPHSCSVGMKIIHLRCRNLRLQLQMQILTSTEKLILLLSVAAYWMWQAVVGAQNLTKIAAVALAAFAVISPAAQHNQLQPFKFFIPDKVLSLFGTCSSVPGSLQLQRIPAEQDVFCSPLT